jgi:hypothetical protein
MANHFCLVTNNLYHDYYGPGTEHFIDFFIYSVFSAVLCDRNYYFLHFADEETEGPRIP